MNVTTSRLLDNYYQRFSRAEIMFSKEIIQTTGLIPEQVQIKCGIDFWPCTLYSTSFHEAKIIVNNKSGILGKLQMADNRMSLRLCFKSRDKEETITFFAAGIIKKTEAYENSPDSSLLFMQFPKRPPDDLIAILGKLIDADVNSRKWKEEKIPITNETQRKLLLFSRESAVFIQGVPRKCLLREISFSGAKIIITGIAKFLLDKETSLRIDFDEPRESVLIRGKFTASESVEGKKEMLGMIMEYSENEIPKIYKIRLNDYFRSYHFARDNAEKKKTEFSA